MGIRAVKSDTKEIALGIRIMNRYKKFYTKRSLGSIEENRRWHYITDPEGNYTDIPIDKWNHAKDAERYIFLTRLSNISDGFAVTSGSAKRR